jgi:penicillin V acylase-like amidase (Ntn superfamily)
MLPFASGKRVSGRTLDFDDSFSDWYWSGIPKDSELTAYVHLPKDEKQPDFIPKPYTWKAKFGCIGLGLCLTNEDPEHPEREVTEILNPQYALGDGMNEAGFSAAALWLPGTVFPSVGSAPPNGGMLSGLDMALWAMTSYDDVQVLEDDLYRIKARAEHPDSNEDQDLPAFWNPLQYRVLALSEDFGNAGWQNLMPFHYVFHDRHGRSLVLEFRDGKMEITNTTNLGVLTNNPFLDWHVANLGNYLNLTNVDIEKRTLVNLPLSTTGDGGSTIALPGSPLPSSRFVRAAYLLDFAKGWLPDATMDQARAFGFSLIGNVSVLRTMAIQSDPPNTYEKEPDKKAKLLYDYTQVALLRDHASAEMYFRTGYGIGTWQFQIGDTLAAKGLFCEKLRNQNEGVEYWV